MRFTPQTSPFAEVADTLDFNIQQLRDHYQMVESPSLCQTYLANPPFLPSLNVSLKKMRTTSIHLQRRLSLEAAGRKSRVTARKAAQSRSASERLRGRMRTTQQQVACQPKPERSQSVAPSGQNPRNSSLTRKKRKKREERRQRNLQPSPAQPGAKGKRRRLPKGKARRSKMRMMTTRPRKCNFCSSFLVQYIWASTTIVA